MRGDFEQITTSVHYKINHNNHTCTLSDGGRGRRNATGFYNVFKNIKRSLAGLTGSKSAVNPCEQTDIKSDVTVHAPLPALPSPEVTAIDTKPESSRLSLNSLVARSPRPSLSASDCPISDSASAVQADIGPPQASQFSADPSAPVQRDDVEEPPQGHFDRWGVFSRNTPPGGSAVGSSRTSTEDQIRAVGDSTAGRRDSIGSRSGRRDSIGSRKGGGSFGNRIIPIPETRPAPEGHSAPLTRLDLSRELLSGASVMSISEMGTPPGAEIDAGGMMPPAVGPTSPLEMTRSAQEGPHFNKGPFMQSSPFEAPPTQHFQGPEPFSQESLGTGSGLLATASGVQDPAAAMLPMESSVPAPFDISGWVVTRPDRRGTSDNQFPSRRTSNTTSRWGYISVFSRKAKLLCK